MVGDHGRADAGEDAHHLVPRREVGDVGGDLDDDSGALAADGRIGDRIHAEHDEHVAEVDPRRPHRDSDLSRLQRGGVGHFGQDHVVAVQGAPAPCHQLPGR